MRRRKKKETKKINNLIIYSLEFFETLLVSHIVTTLSRNETRIDFAYVKLLRRRKKKKQEKNAIHLCIHEKRIRFRVNSPVYIIFHLMTLR